MKKIAYLTFDDGPLANTPKILEILDTYKAKATFFIQGNHVTEEFKPWLKRLDAEGHYIGLHSITHDFDTFYKDPQGHENLLREMFESQALIKEITGKTPTLYRPPFGSNGNFTEAHIETMKASGLKCWDWHVDSRDWDPSTTSEEVIANVTGQIKEQNTPSPVVILFHELFQSTIDGLPTVIEFLLAQGYELVTYNPEEHFPVNLIGVEGL